MGCRLPVRSAPGCRAVRNENYLAIRKLVGNAQPSAISFGLAISRSKAWQIPMRIGHPCVLSRSSGRRGLHLNVHRQRQNQNNGQIEQVDEQG